MLGWKLLAVPGVIIIAGLSYAAYAAFLETSISEEQTATRQARAGPFPTKTRSLTPMPTPAPMTANPPAAPSAGDAVLVGAGDISSCTQGNDDRTAKLLDGVVSGARGE